MCECTNNGPGTASVGTAESRDALRLSAHGHPAISSVPGTPGTVTKKCDEQEFSHSTQRLGSNSPGIVFLSTLAARSQAASFARDCCPRRNAPSKLARDSDSTRTYP
eukprot:474393-Rhodomonas_salina.1